MAARAAVEGTGASLVVGGVTAHDEDVDQALSGARWKIIAFVLVASYLILLLLLRSVLLPLKAVVMNLLSVGAAYGVLVMVFQWGWLDWTGYDSPGYLDSLVPVLVLAVTFGLSMDYEVFLLTRIREFYATGIGNEAAVGEGLAASARVITAAALIMVGVFAAFAIFGAASLKETGVGLAVAIFVDATVTRLVLVPATMRLLGDWNWWLPRRVERLLDRAHVPATG
jgi:RND superfamily putative drug exporter